MSNPFDTCRHNLGKAPRRFGRAEIRNLLLKTPKWVADQPIQVVANAQKMLITRGCIVPAALLYANEQLWAPGRWDALAMALWTPDPRLETDLHRLHSLASELYGYYTTGFPTEFQNFAKTLSRKEKCPLNEPLPADWGLEGAPLFFSDLLVWRDHLPCRFFNSSVVPLLVLPEETKAAMILPGQFWADELKDR